MIITECCVCGKQTKYQWSVRADVCTHYCGCMYDSTRTSFSISATAANTVWVLSPSPSRGVEQSWETESRRDPPQNHERQFTANSHLHTAAHCLHWAMHTHAFLACGWGFVVRMKINIYYTLQQWFWKPGQTDWLRVQPGDHRSRKPTTSKGHSEIIVKAEQETCLQWPY